MLGLLGHLSLLRRQVPPPNPRSTEVELVLRYIVTGAPGAGKTTILAGLRSRGYAVVDEAVTDLIATQHARGQDQPWGTSDGPGFLDVIVGVQRERQNHPAPPGAEIQLYDRSPICTVALARYLDLPVTPALASEVERVVDERIYERQVFLVDLLGFVTPTAVRRISLAQSRRFGQIHEDVYAAYGYDLVRVPAGPVEDRIDLVECRLRSWRTRSSS
jgi:predicted ATPase